MILKPERKQILNKFNGDENRLDIRNGFGYISLGDLAMTDYLEIEKRWNEANSVKEAAEALSMTEGALKAQVSRMRKREWKLKPLPRGRKRIPIGSGGAEKAKCNGEVVTHEPV